ncbi:glycosyltransferase family protein [Arthrobacter sp. TMN-50]
MTPQILCISFSDIDSDSRVLRQLKLLCEAGEVTTVGYGSTPAGVREHLEIDSSRPSLPQTIPGVAKLALRRHEAVELHSPAEQDALKLLSGRKFDLVVANEARALPLAYAIAGGAPVWGDMHEWAPEERTQVLSWKLLVAPYMVHVCRRYLPTVGAVTTVNRSIAELYQERFGVPTEVVRNSLPCTPLEPSPLESGTIRLVHSGGAVPGRNLESLIRAVSQLGDRFTLDFYLVEARDGGKYLRTLKDLAGDDTRIRFHPPVKPVDLARTLNAYDVGVYQLPPATTNQRLALPNKFFDFVQARLALVFGPSIEISQLVRQYDLGWVTDDFGTDSLVKTLNELTSEAVQQYKQNSHLAAAALSSTEDEKTSRAIISRLLRATG